MTSKSLYVHIPFCRSKCAYCDFFSRVESRFVPDTYLDALIRELSFYTVQYGIEQFRTVYLGGGTPSLLSPPQLSRLLHAACSGPLPPEEVTVEMNPESLSEDLLAVFADCPAERKRPARRSCRVVRFSAGRSGDHPYDFTCICMRLF